MRMVMTREDVRRIQARACAPNPAPEMSFPPPTSPLHPLPVCQRDSHPQAAPAPFPSTSARLHATRPR